MSIRESPPPVQVIGTLTDSTGGSADGTLEAVTLTDNTGGTPDGTLEAISIKSEKFWGFASPSGSSGIFHWGGFHKHSPSANDFSGGPSFGSANVSYAAHFFIVLGAATVDELTLTITGTSINDTATRTTSDTQNIVIPTSTSADAYYETSKKWLGAVVVTVASGTAKICDYGYAKHWDNGNTDFIVKGLEVTWLAGATDTAPNIELHHHKFTGWTYTGTGATPPAPIAAMATDHGTESQTVNNEPGAWKRTNLDTAVSGSGSEGIMFIVTTTANKAFEEGTLQLTIETPSEINNNFSEIATELTDVNNNFAEVATKINSVLNTADRHGSFST